MRLHSRLTLVLVGQTTNAHYRVVGRVPIFRPTVDYFVFIGTMIVFSCLEIQTLSAGPAMKLRFIGFVVHYRRRGA